jgi:anti-sigma B factor antagonist
VRDGNSPMDDDPAQGTASASTSNGHLTAAAEPGSVHVILGAERTRIVLSGEIDADLGADLQEATAEAERAGLPIEVDAHHVTFMDSSGVAFLARLSTRSPSRVRLIRVPPTVRFLLEVTRIGELLDVVDGDPGFDPATPDGPATA